MFRRLHLARQNVVMIIGRLRSLNFEWPTPLAGSSSTFYAAKCPSLDGEISPVGRAPELSAGYSPARSASFRCRKKLLHAETRGATVPGLSADRLLICRRVYPTHLFEASGPGASAPP